MPTCQCTCLIHYLQFYYGSNDSILTKITNGFDSFAYEPSHLEQTKSIFDFCENQVQCNFEKHSKNENNSHKINDEDTYLLIKWISYFLLVILQPIFFFI